MRRSGGIEEREQMRRWEAPSRCVLASREGRWDEEKAIREGAEEGALWLAWRLGNRLGYSDGSASDSAACDDGEMRDVVMRYVG